MNTLTMPPKDYLAFLEQLKTRIKTAQLQAVLTVNSELILLYYRIGRDILSRQNQQGWGTKIIDQLSKDLRSAFPNMKGFSVRNIKYMRALAEAWPDEEFVQQAVAQIPWGHNIRILDKISEQDVRRFYIERTRVNGWSRNILLHQIETGLHKRQAKAHTNFDSTLPPTQSDLAQQVTKDPYIFDFLTLAEDARERELEQGLIDHVQQFLVEMGAGFAFVARQKHLEVGENDYYLDLLFYHLKLRCFVVIDLKTTEFKPEYAGKMNFYLSAVDDLLRHPDDNPSIGLLLCKSKSHLVVEYALRGFNKPIGVADWETRIVSSLPDEFKGSLPTVEQLEQELSDCGEP